MSAVESWFAPAVVAEPLPERRSPQRRPAQKAVVRKPSPRQGRRVRGSLVWMVVFALLLLGVVTLNVAVLRANVSVTDLDTKITKLEGENASLASQYSRATAAPRIEDAARRAGLVPASGLETTLLDMGGHK